MKKINLKKYAKLGIKKIRHRIAVVSYLKFGYPLPKPEKIYYLISNKCNFQCQMCPQWKEGKSEDAKEYISTGRMKEIIDEMTRLGIGELGISGGEPLIYREKVMELLEYANGKGLYTHFATNGSLLTEEILDQYDRVGGGHISLSIDAIGDKHDELRGYKNAFAAVKKVLEIYKNNEFKNILLKINLTLSDKNLDEALEVVRLAVRFEAPIFIQPFDPYAYGEKYKEKFPLWVKKENLDKLKNVINEVKKIKKKNPEIILNSLEHLSDFEKYFKEEKAGRACTAPLNQLSVDPFGKIIFCKFGKIGDLKNSSLRDFLSGPKRKAIIRGSLACEEGCLLGCMYDFPVKEMAAAGMKRLVKLIKS